MRGSPKLPRTGMLAGERLDGVVVASRACGRGAYEERPCDEEPTSRTTRSLRYRCVPLICGVFSNIAPRGSQAPKRRPHHRLTARQRRHVHGRLCVARRYPMKTTGQPAFPKVRTPCLRVRRSMRREPLSGYRDVRPVVAVGAWTGRRVYRCLAGGTNAAGFGYRSCSRAAVAAGGRLARSRRERHRVRPERLRRGSHPRELEQPLAVGPTARGRVASG